MKDNELTPMAAQYWELKQDVGDDVLLAFRLGDFYEFFYDDAVKASEVLQIVLTSREFGKGNRVPMCGVPHHAFESYVARLVGEGFKVAVCEQMEDPKKAKGLVKRDIIRIYTPGTFVEGTQDHVWLAILRIKHQLVELLFLDVTTGDFMLEKVPVTEGLNTIEDYFYTFMPRELLIPVESADHPLVKKLLGKLYTLPVTVVEDAHNLEDIGKKYLASLKANAQISLRKEDEEHMEIPPEAVRALELIYNPVTNSKKGSLLELLDSTLTPMGHRELYKRIISPWANVESINQHLDLVEYMVLHPSVLEDVREKLRGTADVERILNILQEGTNVKVKQLLDTKEALIKFQSITHTEINDLVKKPAPNVSDVVDLLEKSLTGNDGDVGSGDIINPEWDEELKQLLIFERESQKWLASFETSEKEKTGIKNLKVGYNDTFGYYIEVPKSRSNDVPDYYMKRQTLVNGERFVTKELLEFESKVQDAFARIEERETDLFKVLVKKVAEHSEDLTKVAEWLAYLDVAASLSLTARKLGWTRPKIVSERVLRIKNGKHPVVEWYSDVPFVPNSVDLGGDIVTALVTGPNMAGKSTFLRQTAIIVLLAHMGSFVPAEEAVLPLTRKIFARMGAADEIIYGRSTFMVEMTQIARILRESDDYSLVVIDEVGRGTAVADGLAIAWAIVKELSLRKKKPFALISTHYPEIAELSADLPVRFLAAQVAETEEGLTFLYRIEEGVSDKAYGLQVAALAGIPQHVLKEADKVFQKLSNQELFEKPEAKQMRLF
ncbi:DNA mismatch repair protein MutS [Coprothermobacter platensis]|uniref:DNA mismatch repair protein MutS n=1 Tax=Coprothermobacter platensis TaxID=108819 RepID=UPI00037AA241|nr:DNA mismatch repair protein MutS [Coprothermobacter platensis]